MHDGIKMHVPKYGGTLHALVTIGWQGRACALYAGLSPNQLGSTAAWGSYFYCYNLLGTRREPTLLDAPAPGPQWNRFRHVSRPIPFGLSTSLAATGRKSQPRLLRSACGTMVCWTHSSVFKSDGIAGLYKGWCHLSSS